MCARFLECFTFLSKKDLPVFVKVFRKERFSARLGEIEIQAYLSVSNTWGFTYFKSQ